MSFCFYQLLDVTFQFFRMESEVCLGVRVARILPKPSKAFTKAKPIIACDHCWHTRLTTFSANGVFEIILVVFCARINIQHAVRTASDTYHVAPNHVLHTAEPTETLRYNCLNCCGMSGVRTGAATTIIHIIRKIVTVGTDRTSAFFTMGTDISICNRPYQCSPSLFSLSSLSLPLQQLLNTLVLS